GWQLLDPGFAAPVLQSEVHHGPSKVGGHVGTLVVGRVLLEFALDHEAFDLGPIPLPIDGYRDMPESTEAHVDSKEHLWFDVFYGHNTSVPSWWWCLDGPWCRMT